MAVILSRLQAKIHQSADREIASFSGHQTPVFGDSRKEHIEVFAEFLPASAQRPAGRAFDGL